MPMDSEQPDDLDNDPIFQLLISGRAQTWREAENLYIEDSWPKIMALLDSPITNAELEAHSLIEIVRRHGTRGWEDSIL